MAQRRYLIVNPFGIGDVIFTMPLIEVLRKNNPDVFIGFVCNERTFELVRLNTSIDRTVIFNRDRFRRLWKKHPLLFYKKIRAFLSLLREDRWDTLVDLSLGREAGFFAKMLGIRERIGFDHRGRAAFLTKKISLEGYEGRPVAEIQLDLLRLLNVPRPNEFPRLSLRVPDSATIAQSERLKKNGFKDTDRIVAVAPGGGRSWGSDAVYKQWDVEYFALAADNFCKNRTEKTKIVILGDRSEQALAEALKNKLQTPAVAACGFSLEEAAALLLRSQILLCNDGGLMHLANALGVRTVSIFGPVDEKVYGPYGGSAKREVLTEAVPCRPCYQKFHFPPCRYERRCLTELSVEKVTEALKKIA